MELNSKNLHHANLILGSSSDAESYTRSLCDELGIRLAGNPDFFHFKTETFGIDEARDLRLISGRKALTGRKIFLITPTLITLEAQNALLKTFEDPFPDTYFFLSVREESIIVPTLRSRMSVIALLKSASIESDDAKRFYWLPIRERLLFSQKFAEEKRNLIVFLDNLLSLLRREEGKENSVKNVFAVRRLIRDTSVPSKLVMEHLSLVV